MNPINHKFFKRVVEAIGEMSLKDREAVLASIVYCADVTHETSFQSKFGSVIAAHLNDQEPPR